MVERDQKLMTRTLNVFMQVGEEKSFRTFILDRTTVVKGFSKIILRKNILKVG